MARGWESKSVESQMDALEAKPAAPQRTTPTPEQLRKQRERESLELSRKRVLQDIQAAKHIRHQLQLEAALRTLDQRIKDLDAE